MSKTSATAEVLTALTAQYALSRLLSRASTYAETQEAKDLCGHPLPVQRSATPVPAR